MTQQEFEQRTGVQVSSIEFNVINEFYMTCECDKDVFCKMWCKMNANRVKDAKVERMIEKRDAAYKDALRRWFDKWAYGEKFRRYWSSPVVYCRMSVYEIKAMSYAGITMHDATLSDVVYNVGCYLGIYKKY